MCASTCWRPARQPTRVRLGVVSTRATIRAAWTATLATGKYTARLVVTGAGVTRYLRVAAERGAPPAPTPTPAPAPASLSATTGSKVFPVQGPYSLGGDDARFGAGRTGHTHQGQDIVAAEGLPVVTPVAGVVHWTAYQAAGAGHYVVIRAPTAATTSSCTCRPARSPSRRARRSSPASASARSAPPAPPRARTCTSRSGPRMVGEQLSAPIDPLPELLAWAA